MTKREPGMLLVAAGCLVLAGALGYAAYRAFKRGGAGMRFLGSALALGAFLAALLALACVVLSFGVDFK